jgi:hypothetical protein
MARGDVHIFSSFLQKSKAGVGFNLASDTIKIGIVGNGIVPTISTTDPRWGASGTTNFAAQEVAHGTGYTAPITLTNVTYTRSGVTDTFDADNVSTIAQDSSGFTNAYYGILYDDTVSGKYAIGYVDLGGPVSIVTGPLNINWNASGIFAETAA